MALLAQVVDPEALAEARVIRQKSVKSQEQAITACSKGDIELAESHRSQARIYQDLAGVLEARAFGLPTPQYDAPLGSRPPGQ